MFFKLYLFLVGNLGRLSWARLWQPQEQRYLFLPACVVFSYVQTVVWLPVFRIFNVCTDVDACDCTWGLHGHRKRVCTESWVCEKNPLLHQGIEPSLVLHLAFLSDAVPTELFHPSLGMGKEKSCSRETESRSVVVVTEDLQPQVLITSKLEMFVAATVQFAAAALRKYCCKTGGWVVAKATLQWENTFF